MNILYLNRVINIGGVTQCILKLSTELHGSHNITIASQGGEVVGTLEKMKIKHYSLYDVESKNPLKVIGNILKVLMIISREKIDIIHSHHRMTTLVGKVVSKLTGVSVIHTQHLCIDDKYYLTKKVLENIPVITVSNAAKEILVKKSGLDKSYIKTIYNTIELKSSNKEVVKKLIELKKEGYFIVSQISRVVDYKGVYDFIDIAQNTIKDNKKIKFILVGDGPEFNNIEGIINERSLDNDIILLGSVTNVIEHLKYIDLVVLCSYIEGLPLAPLEAFSQSKPVIATNIDGTNEEIIDGYNGYLIQPKDIMQFKEKILSIYYDEDQYREFCINAKKTFDETFNTKQYITAHKDFYDKVLNKQKY